MLLFTVQGVNAVMGVLMREEMTIRHQFEDGLPRCCHGCCKRQTGWNHSSDTSLQSVGLGSWRCWGCSSSSLLLQSCRKILSLQHKGYVKPRLSCLFRHPEIFKKWPWLSSLVELTTQEQAVGSLVIFSHVRRCSNTWANKFMQLDLKCCNESRIVSPT